MPGCQVIAVTRHESKVGPGLLSVQAKKEVAMTEVDLLLDLMFVNRPPRFSQEPLCQILPDLAGFMSTL